MKRRNSREKKESYEWMSEKDCCVHNNWIPLRMKKDFFYHAKIVFFFSTFPSPMYIRIIRNVHSFFLDWKVVYSFLHKHVCFIFITICSILIITWTCYVCETKTFEWERYVFFKKKKKHNIILKVRQKSS